MASWRSSLKFRLPAADSSKGDGKGDGGIPIRGLAADIPVRFAPEGGAVPGDRIVGILTPGEGITIYPIHSPALCRFDDEPERWVDVRWDISENSTERFPARIRVSALNEPGTLATIAEVIGAADGNIDNLRMLGRGRDFTEIEIDLEVWNLKHLNRIVTGLREKRVVSQADAGERLSGSQARDAVQAARETRITGSGSSCGSGRASAGAAPRSIT